MSSITLPDFDRDGLVDLLREFSGKTQRSAAVELEPAYRAHSYYLYNAIEPREVVADLTKRLRGVRGFDEFVSWHARPCPNSGMGPLGYSFAEWLLGRLLEASVEDVADGALAFIRKNSSDIADVLVLWGVRPTREIDLGAGGTLLPIEQFEPPLAPDWILRHRAFPPGLAIHIHALRVDSLKPTAVLVQRGTHAPIFTPSSFPGGGMVSDVPIREAAESLTLLTAGPVLPMFEFFQAPIDDPIVGGTSSPQVLEVNWPMYFEPVAAEIGDERFSRAYCNLPKSSRDRFRIALECIAAAQELMRRGRYERVPAELGIALESVLSSEQSTDSISLKIRQRAAAWVGGDKTEKRATYDHFKTLYELRSRVLHGERLPVKKGSGSRLASLHGTIKVAGNSMPVPTFMRESLLKVVQVVGKSIERGIPVDWEAVVLTGDSEW